MADVLQQAGLSKSWITASFWETHSVINSVAVDGVDNQVQAGGIVKGERPEGLCWQRKREGDGIVIACGGIQSPVLGVHTGLEVDDLLWRQSCYHILSILCSQHTHRVAFFNKRLLAFFQLDQPTVCGLFDWQELQ